jgi:uncharacterized protein DUF1638
MPRYEIIACHVLWREICHFAADSPAVLHPTFLQQGLHCTPETLRAALQGAIDAVPEERDAVLIGYGLCSNGVAGIVARDLPLVVPRAHDCITLLLGSKERYREYFDAHAGTYWYSPGWIDTGTQPGRERYESALARYGEKYGEDNGQYLMEMEQAWFREYSTAAYVDLAFADSARHKEYTRRCAEWLNWDYEELVGDARLLTAMLSGDWPEEDFLIVQPGERIAASFDEGIIKAVPDE